MYYFEILYSFKSDKTINFKRIKKKKKIAVSFAAFLEHLKYQTKIEKESKKMYAKSLSFKWKWQIVENFLTL